MPHQTRISTLEAALMIVIAVVAVLLLVAALAPILDLIGDGFKLLAAVFSGDLSGIGSLIK